MKQFNKILNIFMIGCVMTFAMACSDDDENTTGKTTKEPENPVTGISLSNVTDNAIVLEGIGATTVVDVTTAPSNADNADEYYYEFISGNQSVFVVDNSGKITATGWGNAVLTVAAKNNAAISTKCNVTVLGDTPVENILIEENLREINITYEYNNDALPHYNPPSVQRTYNLGAAITIYPENASVKTVKYSTSDDRIASVNGDGSVYIRGYGQAIIHVEAIDGSGIYTESVINVSTYKNDLINRSEWKAIDSSPYITTEVPEFRAGGPYYAIDDPENNTVMALIKSGAAGGPQDGIMYFIIDMGTPQEFNFFNVYGTWAGSVNSYVKINRLSLYGSNDGSNFTALQENMVVRTNQYEDYKILDDTHTFRYVKVVVSPSNSSITEGRDFIIVKDFNLGKRYFLAAP